MLVAGCCLPTGCSYLPESMVQVVLVVAPGKDLNFVPEDMG